jgi:hypothetical protein
VPTGQRVARQHAEDPAAWGDPEALPAYVAAAPDGRERPGTGWLHVTNRTLWASDGFCVDESTLHDRDGRPLAQLRQGRAVRWSGP